MTKKLSIIQEAVLAQIPRGLENPIGSHDIARNIGLSKRDVMAVISGLILDHEIPIGGARMIGKSGYFIITNEDERQQALVPLKKTVVSMQQRIEQLESIKIS